MGQREGGEEGEKFGRQGGKFCKLFRPCKLPKPGHALYFAFRRNLVILLAWPLRNLLFSVV